MEEPEELDTEQHPNIPTKLSTSGRGGWANVTLAPSLLVVLVGAEG